MDEAIGLAQSMLAAGEAAGKQTTAFVTSMNEPIGREFLRNPLHCAVRAYGQLAGSRHLMTTQIADTALSDVPVCSIAGTVGNWLEVIECIDTLNGNGPADLEELVVVQSAQMLVQSGVVDSRAEGIVMCKQVSGHVVMRSISRLFLV